MLPLELGREVRGEGAGQRGSGNVFEETDQ